MESHMKKKRKDNLETYFNQGCIWTETGTRPLDNGVKGSGRTHTLTPPFINGTDTHTFSHQGAVCCDNQCKCKVLLNKVQ